MAGQTDEATRAAHGFDFESYFCRQNMNTKDVFDYFLVIFPRRILVAFLPIFEKFSN